MACALNAQRFWGERVGLESAQPRERRRAPVHLSAAALVTHMRAIHVRVACAYGSPRMWRALKGMGLLVSKSRVEMLMRERGIVAKGKRRFKATTNSRAFKRRRTYSTDSSYPVFRTSAGLVTSLTWTKARVGCTRPLWSICSAGESSTGALASGSARQLAIDALALAAASTDRQVMCRATRTRRQANSRPVSP
jgi:putative transposase